MTTMASLASWRLLILLVLAALLASASAEYTWNGSEWVWTEKEVRLVGFVQQDRTKSVLL